MALRGQAGALHGCAPDSEAGDEGLPRWWAARWLVQCGWLAALLGAAGSAGAANAAGPDGGPVRATLFAAGDIADCRYSRPPFSGAARTAALIAAGPADATVLSLGDHAYPAATATALRGCYDATWGAFRERTRPVLGNHDWWHGGERLAAAPRQPAVVG